MRWKWNWFRAKWFVWPRCSWIAVFCCAFNLISDHISGANAIELFCSYVRFVFHSFKLARTMAHQIFHSFLCCVECWAESKCFSITFCYYFFSFLFVFCFFFVRKFYSRWYSAYCPVLYLVFQLYIAAQHVLNSFRWVSISSAVCGYT